MTRKKRIIAQKAAAKALFGAEITRLMAEYGPVRLAKLEPETIDQTETMVIVSPIFCVPGDVQLPAQIILDGRLYRLGEAAYGSMLIAAREFRGGT